MNHQNVDSTIDKFFNTLDLKNDVDFKEYLIQKINNNYYWSIEYKLCETFFTKVIVLDDIKDIIINKEMGLQFISRFLVDYPNIPLSLELRKNKQLMDNIKSGMSGIYEIREIYTLSSSDENFDRSYNIDRIIELFAQKDISKITPQTLPEDISQLMSQFANNSLLNENFVNLLFYELMLILMKVVLICIVNQLLFIQYQV